MSHPLSKMWHKASGMTDAHWDVAAELFQQRPADGKTLAIWVIYKHPLDAPNHWVVRRWETRDGLQFRGEAYGYKTLEDARTAIPSWAVKMDRAPTDDPNIYESWL